MAGEGIELEFVAILFAGVKAATADENKVASVRL
jgi:hypothetical protein